MEAAKPRIEELAAHHYVACKMEVSAATFKSVVDSNFAKPFAWLAERKLEPAGAPFIRILKVDESLEPAEIEMGVPVAVPVAPGDGLVSGEMPPGSYAVLVHRGPYEHENVDDLTDAQQLLDRFVEEEVPSAGRAAISATGELPPNAEYYEVGPPMEGDFTQWQTRLIRFVG